MSYIETEVRDHVLIITLNRPEARNAFNREMAQEMEVHRPLSPAALERMGFSDIDPLR